MKYLFTVNLVITVCLIFWPVWFSRVILKLPFINPFSLVFGLEFPVILMKLFGGPIFLIEGGLFDIGYQFAILMNNIQLLCGIGGLLLFFRIFQLIRIDRFFPFQKHSYTHRDLVRAERLFLLLFFSFLYLLASSEFGFLNWLLDPRTGYQFYRLGHGHWYALAVSSLSAAFLVGFLARPKVHILILKSLLYISLSYLLGAKGFILSMFGAAIIFLWLIRWKYLARLIFVAAPLVFLLMLVNFFSNSDTFVLQDVFSYFDYYKNAADYYRSYLNGDVGLFYGKVVSSSYWSYVPRALWPEKPFAYGIILVNEIFFPGAAEITNTPAFAGAVEQFADFGVIGVVIYSFFDIHMITTALFAYVIFKKPGLDLNKVSLLTITALIVQFTPSFGLYFPGALYLLLLGVVLIIIRILRFRSPLICRNLVIEN